MTLVHFLGPGSNIFPGMSGIESDWSDRQMLCNTNDATAITRVLWNTYPVHCLLHEIM